MSEQPQANRPAPVVLVTRPAGRAESFIHTLQAAGVECVHLPMLEIKALHDEAQIAAVKSRLHCLDQLDLAIFISTNAVHFTRECLLNNHIEFPAQLPCLPIGRTTADEIARAGWQLVPAPAIEDSEGLLSSPALQQVSGKVIGIFRGVGGREHLARVLRERGAKVDYLECYRRCRPLYQNGIVAGLLKKHSPAAIVFSSGETLDNFLYYAKLDDITGEVLKIPLVVPSQRLQQYAVNHGFTRVVVANGANAEATSATLAGIVA